MLTVSSVTKSFDQSCVLRDVSFDLNEGDTVVILGPSGCGKTTLLNLISGMDKPDVGIIRVNDHAVAKPSTEIAFILQNFGLLPWKTNLQNVALGLKIKGVRRKERNAVAARYLSELGLAGRESDYPSVLSGGEQQRVAIARAYASGPKLLLMDEPFSSLDAITRELLQDTLLNSWKQNPIPYVLVTHSVEEAAYLGKKVLILAGNPSNIKSVVENPGFGTADYRKSREYYQLVRSIRKEMEALW